MCAQTSAAQSSSEPLVRYQSNPVAVEPLDDERGIVRTPRLNISSIASYYQTYASKQDRTVLGAGVTSTLHIPLGMAFQVGATFRFERILDLGLDNPSDGGRFFDLAPLVQVRLPTPTFDIGFSIAAGVSRFGMGDYTTTGFVLNPELNARFGRIFGAFLAVGLTMRNWPGDNGVRDLGIYVAFGTSTLVWSYR